MKLFAILLGVGSLLLTSCEKPINLNYLLIHPLYTKEKAINCYESQSETDECKQILLAYNRLMTATDEQQSDPEAFGQKIMDKQIKFMALKQKLQNETTNTAELKSQIEELGLEIRMLLAVAGLNRPE